MRTFRAKTGPLKERLYLEPHEIENICSDELRAVGLYPGQPEPIRIDRFIEKRFKIPHRYEELPEGVLGLTRFGPNGVEDIIVAKALDDDGTEVAERRIVTTLAHEAGHGLFHTYYFALGTKPRSLFGESASNEPLILCRDETTAAAYSGQWWEYQANKAMAALLLPSQLVTTALEPYLLRLGSFGAIALDQDRRTDAIDMLSETFKVNPVVARLRLEALYPDTPQLTL